MAFFLFFFLKGRAGGSLSFLFFFSLDPKERFFFFPHEMLAPSSTPLLAPPRALFGFFFPWNTAASPRGTTRRAAEGPPFPPFPDQPPKAPFLPNGQFTSNTARRRPFFFSRKAAPLSVRRMAEESSLPLDNGADVPFNLQFFRKAGQTQARDFFSPLCAPLKVILLSPYELSPFCNVDPRTFSR